MDINSYEILIYVPKPLHFHYTIQNNITQTNVRECSQCFELRSFIGARQFWIPGVVGTSRSVTLLLCYSATLLHTLLLCYSITLRLCDSTTLRLYFSTTLLLYYYATLLLCYYATLLLCHSATLQVPTTLAQLD